MNYIVQLNLKCWDDNNHLSGLVQTLEFTIEATSKAKAGKIAKDRARSILPACEDCHAEIMGVISIHDENSTLAFYEAKYTPAPEEYCDESVDPKYHFTVLAQSPADAMFIAENSVNHYGRKNDRSISVDYVTPLF